MRKAILVLLVVAAAGVPARGAPPRTAPVEPGLLEATEPVAVIARFERDVPAIDGLAVRYRFASVPAVYGVATPAAVRALAAQPGLVHLEADKAIAYTLDSAVRATRADQVWAPGSPISDPQGRVVDGSGVGIAIVDTGLDGLHPDYEQPGKVGGNWTVTPAGLVEAAYTSTVNDGHGTHVAGIAAGNGALSGGIYRGVAPGATLYAFNMFAGANGSVVFPAIAFDWILQNGASLSPPIKVVNNSWRCLPNSCANAFNPNQLHNTLASRLAENGVVITWASGNEGGDGTSAMTVSSSINPTPGIIGVANYKDERTTFDTGVRDNRVSSTSSRGDATDPATWPDVAAPGSDVISTWAVTARTDNARVITRNPSTGENSYILLNGTSMAAPHVAGIVALMLQANPSLSAGDVEYILKATADPLPSPYGYVRSDPAHPWNGANYAEGHGLVHAFHAVEAARSFAGRAPWVDPEPVPEWFTVSRPAIDVERTLFLTEDLGMTGEYPEGPARGRHQGITRFLTYTSDPLEDAQAADAMLAQLYMGTAHEYVATTHSSLRVRVVAEHVAPDGTRTELGTATDHTWNTAFGSPLHRTFHIFFPETTFAAGDRIGFGVILEKRPGATPAPVSDLTLIEGGIVMYTGDPSASRIGLGRTVARPESSSDEACRTWKHCATIGGTVRYATVVCGNVPMRLSWQGPAGSSLIHQCDNTVASCTVPGMPGDPDGSCEARVGPVHVTPAARDGQCAYVIPGGGRGGSGRCEAEALVESDR